MKQQNSNRNSGHSNHTGQKQVGQDGQRQGTDLNEGKRMVNPTSPDLSGDIGKRKSQDYPGDDRGLTGRSAEEKGERQSQQGFQQGTKLGNRSIDEDEDAGESGRGWDSAGNAKEANPYRQGGEGKNY